MKHKLSITMEQQTILNINDRMRMREFKNKSQLIEYAVKEFLTRKLQ
ncbi:TPA: hypothetical protein HA253_00350 [Candidatus Woesearchaeota archaeon]|nr:hypothetical protein [Candidatus Woesearchaeota archaeon]